MNAEQRQVAAELWTTPSASAAEATIMSTYINHRHFITTLLESLYSGWQAEWKVGYITYRDGLPVRRQSPIQIVTGPGVEQLR